MRDRPTPPGPGQAPAPAGPAVADALPAVPRLRGRLHQACAVAAVPAAVAMARAGRGRAARAAGAAYGAGLVTLFSVSAAYHRGRWSPVAKRRLKRADHVAIYVFTAASYTPLSLALPARARAALLAAVWSSALGGSAVKAARLDRAGGLADVLYMVTGWAGLPALPLLLRRLSPGQLVLLLAGGVGYTSGAAVLVRQRPDPVPHVFGYHELGHLVMLGGTVLHYVLDRSILGAHPGADA